MTMCEKASVCAFRHSGMFFDRNLTMASGNRAFRNTISSTDDLIDGYCAKLAELRAVFMGQSTLSTQTLVHLILEKVESFGEIMWWISIIDTNHKCRKYN